MLYVCVELQVGLQLKKQKVNGTNGFFGWFLIFFLRGGVLGFFCCGFVCLGFLLVYFCLLWCFFGFVLWWFMVLADSFGHLTPATRGGLLYRVAELTWGSVAPAFCLVWILLPSAIESLNPVVQPVLLFSLFSWLLHANVSKTVLISSEEHINFAFAYQSAVRGWW